jgi:predicted  nucleic acid-binding Zn-ribbon protein
LKTQFTGLETKVTEMQSDIKYVRTRAENASESTAVVEAEHGQKIGALFDKVSLIHDDVRETNAIVKALHEKQENQELSIKWIDSRMKKAAI